MDCASCAAKVENAVRRLAGVSDVVVSVPAETVTVIHDGTTASAAIARQIAALGYKVGRHEENSNLGREQGRDGEPGHHLHSHEHEEEGPWWRSRKGSLTIGCGVALLAAYAAGLLFPSIERGAFLAALAVGLLPIAWRALTAARYGSPFTIETLMTIAAAGAVIIGEVEEAGVVVLLFLVGELLEGIAAGRARASIRGLTRLVPKTAFLETDGRAEEVPAERLEVGSTILVRPGDRIPADGIILSGTGNIDEAPVTGESVQKQKTIQDKVFAGTINLDAALRVGVTAAAQDNTIARVVRLVEEAQEAKAPTERFIDRFSRYYTPGVLLVGLLVAIMPPLVVGASWGEWVYKGLAVLLIGCPCALVISTPAAIAAGLSAGARRGLLIKGGAVLETLGKVTMAAFDKTGTLTEGRPGVTDVIPFGRSERDVISLAAALETGSSHPLARAILDHAAATGAPIPPAASVTAVAGRGVAGSVGGLDLFLGSPQAAAERASLGADEMARITTLVRAGKTVSVLLAGERLAGVIAMRDEPRPDAREGIQALRRAGVSTLMVTGDNHRAAGAIGTALDIEPRAELLPEDKQRIVRESQSRGHVVAKIGDGINDAPGLAAADAGIAMGGGTDVALETADAAVLHGRVLDVARMVDLSRKTMTNIHQNITIALGLKAVFLVTTIAGITGLWPAILADTGATVLVTMNALRLLNVRLEV
jgi:Cd2+/Zn2+-exporting ATPase